MLKLTDHIKYPKPFEIYDKDSFCEVIKMFKVNIQS